MKLFSLIILCVVLGITAFSAGCATSDKDAAQQTPTPTPSPPANITYEKHGFGFVYPDNLVLTEIDTSEGNTGRWESGEVHLKGESDNITINWMAMHHVPPNIPIVYESMRSSFQKDPRMSDVNFYLLDTYPATTCGDASLIGHVSFYDKVHKSQTNEGLLMWYHPRQDRTYFIDIASGKDYKPDILNSLAGYQQSFRCLDS